MRFQKVLSYAICLFVLTDATMSMVNLTSSDTRQTDIVYSKKLEEDEVEEPISYKDFSVYKTEAFRNASMPDETFLHPLPGSDAIVSNPKNPLEIIIIERPSGNLGIPGGWNMYGENSFDGAVFKFKSKVNFQIEDKVFEAEPLPGFIGRPTLMDLKKKVPFAGPFLGLYGISDRDPNRQGVCSLFHLIIKEEYTNPIPVEGKSQDAFFCDIIAILARNADAITDDIGSHPLKEAFEKVSQQDIALMDQQNDDVKISDLDKCAKEFDLDYVLLIYRYYQALVSRKILNEDGSVGPNMKKYEWMYNKTALLKIYNKM